MNIPDKFKVRTQGKEKNPLAYITYVDEEGKLRSEGSWKKWGDKELPNDFYNTPMAGFKLAGLTQRSADWFGSGRTMFYVIHPYGFTFEISSDNLFALMSHHDIIKGEIMGELILVWDKSAISLIPKDSAEFKNYSKQTKIVGSGTIPMKSLIPGRIYSNREGDDKVVYAGQFYKLLCITAYISPIGQLKKERKTENYKLFDSAVYNYPIFLLDIERIHFFKKYYDEKITHEYYTEYKSKKVYDTGKDTKLSYDIKKHVDRRLKDGHPDIFRNSYTYPIKDGYAMAITEERPDVMPWITKGTPENDFLLNNMISDYNKKEFQYATYYLQENGKLIKL